MDYHRNDAKLLDIGGQTLHSAVGVVKDGCIMGNYASTVAASIDSLRALRTQGEGAGLIPHAFPPLPLGPAIAGTTNLEGSNQHIVWSFAGQVTACVVLKWSLATTPSFSAPWASTNWRPAAMVAAEAPFGRGTPQVLPSCARRLTNSCRAR